jgi:hypothetical protein
MPARLGCEAQAGRGVSIRNDQVRGTTRPKVLWPPGHEGRTTSAQLSVAPRHKHAMAPLNRKAVVMRFTRRRPPSVSSPSGLRERNSIPSSAWQPEHRCCRHRKPEPYALWRPGDLLLRHRWESRALAPGVTGQLKPAPQRNHKITQVT